MNVLDSIQHADFIKETIEVWQPHSHAPLTAEDAKAIIRNVTAFIMLLDEWEKTETGKTQNDKGFGKRACNKT